jgi:EPS-associated MarR family transcriptional regulator
MSEESNFKVLQLLAENPKLTQRELALRTGFSLGKMNFIITALKDKGLIKLESFSTNPNKLNYLYLLTPQGIIQKTNLTLLFLKRKEVEYEALKREIQELKLQIESSEIS